MATVQPAVRSPDEAVQGFVAIVVAPAVEEDLRRAIGFVIAVLVRDEREVGRGSDKDAAKADSDAGAEGELVGDIFLFRVIITCQINVR